MALLTLNDQPHVMAGSAGEVFGSTCVQACVTALGRSNCQGSVGKDLDMSAVDHGPPLLVPGHFRLGLPVRHTLQTDWLAEHCRVLDTRHTQHRWHWENIRFILI